MAKPKPSERWDVVSIFDPAIDQESKEGAAAFERYRLERDLAELKLVPGATATVYVLRPLNSRCVMRWLKPAPTTPDLQERAFRAAVVAIRNFRGPTDEEHPIEFTPGRYEKAHEKGRDAEVFDLWEDDEINRVHPSVIEEIGDVAAARAFFHPRIWPRFVLLPTSAQMLGTQRLRAELASATRTGTTSGSGAAPPPTNTD